MQAIGEKGKKFMKKQKAKKIKYTDEPIGKVRIIKDFLPPPHKLVLRQKVVKVTLALSEKSVVFFKKEAEKHQTHYQQMIRNLLDDYVRHHQEDL